MAQVTEVRLVDDLDGGEADKSVVFAIDNKQYEIDLSDQHAAQLRDVFAPFIAVARRAGGASVVRARRGGAVRRSAAREETAAIREWAAAHGFAVSARGRIAASVLAAYADRDQAASVAPAVESPEVESPEVEAEVKPKRRARKKSADPVPAE
jgi:hypothetical protein